MNKKRFVVRIVLVEETLHEKSPNGNGAWIKSNDFGWSKIESFNTLIQANNFISKLFNVKKD